MLCYEQNSTSTCTLTHQFNQKTHKIKSGIRLKGENNAILLKPDRAMNPQPAQCMFLEKCSIREKPIPCYAISVIHRNICPPFYSLFFLLSIGIPILQPESLYSLCCTPRASTTSTSIIKVVLVQASRQWSRIFSFPSQST